MRSRWWWIMLGACGCGLAVEAAEVPQMTIRNAYVEAYMRSQPENVVAVDPMPDLGPVAQPSPLLEGLEIAGPWLRLVGASDADRQWVEAPCDADDTLDARPALCGLRWRRNNAFSDLSTRLDDLSTNVKTRMVGKGLADKLEFDLDSSPEVRFRWEFE